VRAAPPIKAVEGGERCQDNRSQYRKYETEIPLAIKIPKCNFHPQLKRANYFFCNTSVQEKIIRENQRMYYIMPWVLIRCFRKNNLTKSLAVEIKCVCVNIA